MDSLPDEVCKAWENRNGALVFTTVDKNGVPNSIYATCVGLHENRRIVIADNYFSKTRENIFNGSSGSVLFITNDNKAFQIKGHVEYHRDGTLFDFMKCWNPEKHPGHAAAVLIPESVYSGAKKLC